MVETLMFEQVAEQVLFINLDILCWTGSQSLQPQDLGLTPETLPPEKLVHLGSKKLINPETLRVFTSTRAAARRECLAVGTRFLGGFIVPAAKAAALLARLDGLAAKFNAARAAFLDRFEQRVEDWVQDNPDWAPLIRNTAVSQQIVARRLAFTVQAVKLATPSGVEHPGLANATQGLGDTLFQEVAVLAQDALKNSYLGKDSVTQRALRPLRAIQQKLDGLGFLDQRVRPVCRAIAGTLAVLPRKGDISGRDLQAVIGLLAILEDPVRLKAHGDRLLHAAELAPAPDIGLREPAQGERAVVKDVEESSSPAPMPVNEIPPAPKAPSGWF